MIRRFVTPLVFALGCASDAGPSAERLTSTAHGFSVEQPAGWADTVVRGSVQLAPVDAKLARHTIVVRATERPREIVEGTPATPAAIIATTEQVLRDWPRTTVAPRGHLSAARLPGARFALTFLPRRLDRTYRREHVVLVGARRVFHVMYTAPANEAIEESALDRVVATLAEEGS